MPITENISKDGSFLAVWFEGRITQDDLMNAVQRNNNLLPKNGEFVAITIVDPSTDISELDLKTLLGLYNSRAQQLSDLGAKRRAGAAVIPPKSDAPLLTNLWNALCEAGDQDLSFAVFERLSDALNYLEVSADSAREVLASLQRSDGQTVTSAQFFASLWPDAELSRDRRDLCP